ncbi:hypothetical protein AOXY_G17388 [Acipenser oxyrinchus oxyrinchus]|uniref:Uncharacterized protein n=1 Tax=Acipenser oxyrinchus oxyrinchus TaxID=40147 RepID=A0AAD8G4A7_ACIOX|nr:hypothetical protein AOXY_G17388 [Acipenser oxyrinchus oxyrinchus]
MSESSSGVVTSSESLPKSNYSAYSDLSGSNTPLPVILRSRGTEEQSPDSGIASPLPSNRFRFTAWHNLEGHEIRGAQLTSPRVREGPPESELFLRGEENYLIGKRTTEEKGKWESRLQENWENCVELNLSYQDLGDSYQLENFKRILRRLIRVERLQLVDNSLKDLSSIRLPRCKRLNLNKNHLTSIRHLPKIPQIQHLSLAENNIRTLCDLSELGTTPLESLTLKRNPCEFQEDYRSKVFSSLPNLKLLDGIPKLPADCAPLQSTDTSRMCTIL